MANYVERYNAQVDMQIWLDETFPEGAYFAQIIEHEDGSTRPTGAVGTVGRLFVSLADEDEEAWWYQMLLDTLTPAKLALGDAASFPHEVRIREVVATETENMYEAAELGEELEGLVLMRLRSDPAGPRAPEPGQRELMTDAHERRLFPHGITHVTEELVPEIEELEITSE